MELVDIIMVQVLQPFFFYSVALTVVAFASVYALLKINHHLDGRWKSVLIIAPLFVPLLVLAVFSPSLTVSFASLGLARPLPPGGPPGTAFSALPFPSEILLEGPLDSMFSVTGALVITGAVLCVSCLLLSMAFRGRVAKKALHVVALGPQDYPDLQRDVRTLAATMGVRMPELGLVEDLRPNAFTTGWGQGTLMVFSLGLLMMLDEDELRAVAAHELAHVKNRDVMFKMLSTSLACLSFFNPLAFMALKASRRERESMADERAKAAIGDEDALARAITKVASVLERAPQRSAPGWGFCFALSLADRTPLLAAHPSPTERVRRIARPVRGGRSLRSRAVCILLSATVVVLAALLLMNLGEVRAEIVQSVMESPAGPACGAGGPLHNMTPTGSGPARLFDGPVSPATGLNGHDGLPLDPMLDSATRGRIH